MLHMVTMTHGPETCAAVHENLGKKALDASNNIHDAGKKLDVEVKGWWVDPPGHVFYLVADAPNAHVLNRLMTQLELFHWNTIDTRPIITIEEAESLAAR